MGSDIELTEVPNPECVSVRSRVSTDRIPEVTASSFQETMECIAPLSDGPSDPQFALYHHFDDNEADMDCGRVFEGEFPEGGFTLAGGKVVKTRHIGPYDKLVDAFGLIKRNDSIPGTMWDYYLNDFRDIPPEEMVTETHGVYIES